MRLSSGILEWGCEMNNALFEMEVVVYAPAVFTATNQTMVEMRLDGSHSRLSRPHDD